MQEKIKIGLFGFGTVGQGFYKALQQSQIPACIDKIVVKNANKSRPTVDVSFSFHKEEILQDPNIALVVELIDDAHEAYTIVKQALLNDKNVVSANKKMLAYHLPELIEIQKNTGKRLLYEGAACGSIPILRNLDTYFQEEQIESISGIFNGSTNYILSEMAQKGISYGDALKQAQLLGFAESNPDLDVKAYDPAYKLSLLALHGLGVWKTPEQVMHNGIQQLSNLDRKFGEKYRFTLKLVGNALLNSDNNSALWVLPQWLYKDEMLAKVNGANNAVISKGKQVDLQIWIGKGAGGNPTGYAVLSDVEAILCGYGYRYNKYYRKNNYASKSKQLLNIYFRKDAQTMQEIPVFDKIYSEYRSSEGSYITGAIQYETLLKFKNILLESNAFVALLPDDYNQQITLNNDELKTILQTA